MNEDEALNYYLAGFIDGEAGFCFSMQQGTLMLAFSISQCNHVGTLDLLQQRLGGNYIDYTPSHYKDGFQRQSGKILRIADSDTMYDKVIPFVDRYGVLVRNYDRYQTWKKLVEIKHGKRHLSGNGKIEMMTIIRDFQARQKGETTRRATITPLF